MRDKSGRFVKGHTPLTPRDKTTGQFISNKTTDKEPDRYTIVRSEVDIFLKDLEVEHFG